MLGVPAMALANSVSGYWCGDDSQLPMTGRLSDLKETRVSSPGPHSSTVKRLIQSKTISLCPQHGSQAYQEANDSPNHSQDLTYVE